MQWLTSLASRALRLYHDDCQYHAGQEPRRIEAHLKTVLDIARVRVTGDGEAAWNAAELDFFLPSWMAEQREERVSLAARDRFS